MIYRKEVAVLSMGRAMNRATARREVLAILKKRKGGRLTTQAGISSAILRNTGRHVSSEILAQAIDDLDRLGQVKKLPEGGAELLPKK